MMARTKWIHVQNRLPKMDGKTYLTFRKGYKDTANNGISVDTSQGQSFWFGILHGRGFGVTHWMPLPDDPPL